MFRKTVLASLAILLMTTLTLAQEHAVEVADSVPHPAISHDSSWAGVMIIIILGMFLAAAVIGPIVRANTPEELPPMHSHDEPPGASGHHGKSGTADRHDHH